MAEFRSEAHSSPHPHPGKELPLLSNPVGVGLERQIHKARNGEGMGLGNNGASSSAGHVFRNNHSGSHLTSVTLPMKAKHWNILKKESLLK